MLVAMPASGTAGRVEPAARAVEDAIVEAVRERTAADASVEIEGLDVTWGPQGPVAELRATPEPDRRLGSRMRFTLFQAAGDEGVAPRPVGRADALVRVAFTHLRARGSLERGELVTAAHVEESFGDVGPLPLEPLPALDDVVGGTVRRRTQAGEVITGNSVHIAAPVESGQRVRVRLAWDGIEVRTTAVAAQRGARGDLIRLVNPDSGRFITGRVVGVGEVEVVNER